LFNFIKADKLLDYILFEHKIQLIAKSKKKKIYKLSVKILDVFKQYFSKYLLKIKSSSLIHLASFGILFVPKKKSKSFVIY
jgi:hypothetical protein